VNSSLYVFASTTWRPGCASSTRMTMAMSPASANRTNDAVR